MQRTLRTFVAVELSPAIRARAAELIESLRRIPADVKWVDAHNLHLTLKFLDEVPVEEIAAVCQSVQQAAAEVEPFALEVRGAGAFPNSSRPRTIWLGARNGSEQMVELQQRIEDALSKLGFRKEHRRFEPHLTIGRVRRSGPALRDLGNRLGEHAQFEAGELSVEEVVVFSSRLQPGGPVYEALGRAPLGAKT